MNTNEIVKALRDTDFHQDCDYCEHSDLCKDKDCVILQAADTIERLQKELDAAVGDIAKDCEHCKYEKEDYPDNAPHCDKCMKPRINNCGVYCSHSQWQWRGRESEET